MKRSELVKAISKYINNNIQFRDDHKQALRHADLILTILEDYEMSPPSRYMEDIFGNELPEEHTHSWEPENE